MISGGVERLSLGPVVKLSDIMRKTGFGVSRHSSAAAERLELVGSCRRPLSENT